MAKSLRLGLTLSEEDVNVFWQNEKNYVVTLQQKLQFEEVQRIYQLKPIIF